MATPPNWVTQLLPAPSTGADLLAAERAGSAVASDKLAELIHGGRAVLDMRARIEAQLQADTSGVFDLTDINSMSRVDKMTKSLARGKALKKLRREQRWSDEEYVYANGAAGEANTYGLHDKAFIKVLTDQGTEEQKAAFLVPAKQDKIIGCYAQTELSHGSNVRGLETTATWNPDDKTFTIHSPSITACKWWIGTMGRTANTALVMAQLIVNGKNLGPHTFVVPIRDLETHEPLPNVYVGDIGPKIGYGSMDNGFALFNNHKVPYQNMLARFQYIDPATGEYKRRGSPALVYGGMTYLRVGIAFDAAQCLARAAAIAVRYAAVRRQFEDEDDPKPKGETAVLNYKMVQFRLLPAIAASYALHFAGRELQTLYRKYDAALATDQRAAEAILAELHLKSCALKAYSTTVAVEGIETCRRACGGHGYSHYSGIGSIYAEQLPSVTYEGDNYMLTKQVARSLIKSARAALAGKGGKSPIDNVLRNYLECEKSGAVFDVLNSDADIVAAFGWRVAHATFEIVRLRDQEKETWNNLLIPFWRLSIAFGQYLTVSAFFATVSTDRAALVAAVGEPTAAVLNDLFRLFALSTIDNYVGDFADAGAITPKQFRLARHRAIGSLLDKIRPHAIPLVEGWGFSDFILNSSLGRSDGNVYEDMFRKAAANPVNTLTFDPRPESAVLVKRTTRLAKL